MIFSIDLSIFKENLIFPFIQTPRDNLSSGTGILEYILFSFIKGSFPFLLLGFLIVLLLLTNKFFCGWICPVGFIQDILLFFQEKSRRMSIEMDINLKKIKFWIVGILAIIAVSLGLVKFYDYILYVEFEIAMSSFIQGPIAGFSLSEFLFFTIPNSVTSVLETMSFDVLFEGGFWVIFGFFFYIIVIAVSVYYPRFYCRTLCPYGAVSALISRFSFLKFSRNPVKCPGRRECGDCETACPLQIRILDEPFEGYTGNGECNLCGVCKEVCPHDAVKLKFG